jgi:hypothetical protein
VAASSSLSNGAKLQKCSLCGGIDTSNLLTRGQAFAWQRPGRHPDAHHGGVGDGLNERKCFEAPHDYRQYPPFASSEVTAHPSQPLQPFGKCPG